MAEQRPPEGPAPVPAAVPAPERCCRPTRRRVLTLAAVAVAGVATGVFVPPAVNRMKNPAKKPRWKYLSDSEASLLAVVCEQIVPTDQDPGAKQTGAVNFIDKQLVGPYRRYQDLYRNGLAALAATSFSVHGCSFEQLTFDQQTQLLKRLERGNVPKEHWQQVASGEFFSKVIAHTMQGFYGSPRHGGNAHYASYKMLGLEYPRVIGRNKYGA